MRKLIKIPGKWSKGNKYIIYFLIFCTLRNLIPNIIYSILDKEDDSIENYLFDKYFDIISNFASDFLTIFIYLYQKFRSKSDTYYENQEDSVIKTYKKCTILIIAVVDFCCLVLPLTFFCFLKNNENKFNNIKEIELTDDNLFFLQPIDVLFRYIFSIILLKANYYGHHKLSYILIIIGSFPLVILEIRDFTSNYLKETIIYITMQILIVILYSLEDVLNKRALVKYLPAKLIATKAMIQSFMVVIISIIFFVGSFCKNLTITHPYYYLFYRLSFIIFNIFRTYTLVNVIFELGPECLSVPKVLEAVFLFFYYHIRNLILGKNKNKDSFNQDIIYISINTLKHILQFISFIILAIGSLLNSEFFMLNIEGFIEKTKWYMENVQPKLLENDRKANEDQFDSKTLFGE